MALIQIASQAWGQVADVQGNGKRAVTVTFSDPVYTDSGGGTVLSPVQTDSRGVIPGWIAEGTHTLTVPGAAAQTVEAIKGSTVTGLVADVLAVEADIGSADAANGSDDTASLQAKLNANTHVKGKVGHNYIISAPLVIRSGCTLDMTGCTITLKAGTTGNMLNNTALSAARTVIDAAITASDATLTSATAAFTAGDVGKAVTVVGAGANGARLVTTIASYTNSTTVELTATASTTVTNAWVTIGTRDQNITLIGGLWDRGANGTTGGVGYTANSIRLRRIDGLRIRDVEAASTNGKYGVSLGDVWDFRTNGVRGRTTFSDIIHVNGPAQHGVIRDTSADNPGDDVVSLTASDFVTAASMADICGDIADVLVDGVSAGYGTRRGAIGIAGTAPAALGGRAVSLTNITFRNIRGRFGSSGPVLIGGDFQDAATMGGTYQGILIDGVFTHPTDLATQTVFLSEGTYEDVTIRNVSSGLGVDRPVSVGGTVATQVPTIKRLKVDGVTWSGGASPNGVVTVIRGTVTSLEINEAQVTSALSGAFILSLNTNTNTVSRAALSNCDLEVAAAGSTSALVLAQASSTLGVVEIANCHTKNVTYPAGRYYGTTRVKATTIHSEGASSGIRVEAAGVVIFEAQNIDSNADGFSIAAGGSLRLIGFGCRGDILTTGVIKTAGDHAFNTNAARACGVGPVVSDGTNWKGIFNGTNA
jgi:hypothetical protein